MIHDSLTSQQYWNEYFSYIFQAVAVALLGCILVWYFASCRFNKNLKVFLVKLTNVCCQMKSLGEHISLAG